MTRNPYPFFLANKPQTSELTLDVIDKYTQKKHASVCQADKKSIELAIERGSAAAKSMASLTAAKRREILESCLKQIEARREELTKILCIEAGKTIKDSKTEVARLLETFRFAADETSRAQGEVLRLDASARAANYEGMWKRVPVGLCSLVVPFNFPLNLAAHKIAPAIASGCPFILKPATATPLSALILGEILAATDLPPGAFSILPCPREEARSFTEDERIHLLSFTGSPAVGWELKAKAGRKKVILELGGNAAAIVDKDVDLEDTTARLIAGIYGNSGQSCISVQRILIHESAYEALREKLVAASKKLKAGDPSDESVTVGPMISEKEAIRLETWIQEAAKNGGKILCGGGRRGAVLEPTLLENVPEEEKICREEAFGPIAVLSPFKTFEEALERTNRTRFGLQAGVFTQNLNHVMKAWNELEVGGVMINEVPSWRVDHMPYGGVKESGLGREGVRFAMEDMSEMRLLVIRRA